MKKSRKLITFLLATLLVVALMIGVVACNVPEDPSDSDDSTTEETVATESLLVTNGKFSTTTGATYVKTASNWTLTAGSWAKSATGLTTGVVDLSDAQFDANKGAINSELDKPGVAPSTSKTDGAYDDTNALVISMDGDEANGSIFYVSAQSKVAKGEYYKLSVDVWTDLILDENVENDKRGATIVLSQGTSASSVIVSKFGSIDTESNWQTYTFYIEASNFEDRNFYVQLWLGYGPSQIKDVVNVGTTAFSSYYTTKGTAMFDNVVMEKIEKSAYDSALVSQYNAVANATATERNQDMQSVFGVQNDKTVVLSYVYLNNNFTGATGYSTSSTTTTYFTSAKVGSTANYTVVKGKEDLKNDDDFPSYTATTDPVGVFDLTKLYYVDSKASNNYADAYSKVSSTFKAPAGDYIQNLGITYTDGQYKLSTPYNALDNQALLVYHQQNSISGAGFQSSFDILIENNKYYAVSVWAFIWVPTLDKADYCGTEPTAPEAGATDYDKLLEEYNTKLEAYNAKVDQWNIYNKYVEGNEQVKATLRLSGASTDTKLQAQTDGTWGTWQQITLKVKGNELADRKVNIELWYGEGEWGEDTLYPGGCFFDNITIKEYATAEEINAAYPAGEVKEWEKIEAANYAGFGLNGATEAYASLSNDATEGWYYNVIDTNTYVDMTKTDSNLYAGILKGGLDETAYATAKSANPALQNIANPDKVYSLDGDVFDYVVLNNAKYTASKLLYKPADSDTVLKTKPNHFYRASMWVNTQNLKSGSTFSISLYDAENDALINSSATQSSLKVSTWTEISFVMQSSTTESDEMYIVVEFGKGDIYTPASHTQGAVLITAVTWSEIDYSEYNAAKGTYVKSFDLSSSTTTGSSIANSDFSTIDSSNYDLAEDAEAVFNADGQITGIASPKSWTKATEAFLIAAPTLSVSNKTTITWKNNVKEATHYFVYNYNKELIKVIDANDTANYTEDANDATIRTYTFTPNSSKYYYVRALILDGTTVKYASDYSTSKSCSAATGTVETKITHAAEDMLKSVKGGIVNAEYYGGTGLGADFYPTTDGSLGYKSTLSSNLLMLTSSYPTYFGYTNSSSVSLSTESYYRMSVWVKTVDGAKASVTIKNSSNYLAVTHSDEDNGEYVGYTGINTDGKWVRYDFYIATNLSSGSLTLELYLGNKYANNTVAISDNTKVSAGASTGTVYFDDVMLVKLADEQAYNKLVYGVENLEDVTEETLKEMLTKYGVDVNADGADVSVEALLKARKDAALTLVGEKDATSSYLTNAYKYELVNYDTDSFDNYDKKDDEADNNLEALIGNESNSFTHYLSNAVYNGDYAGESAIKDNDYPNHVYGVYNKNGDFEDLIKHMTAKDYLLSDSTYAMADFSEDTIRNFLTTTYTGSKGANNNNYLMMANIAKPSTQSYQTSSLTMAATSYYKITFSAKYLAADSSKNPEFRFIYDNSNGYWETIKIQASEDMVEYTFYYANESAKSASAYLAYFLGSDDAQGDAEDVENLMAGILIVDDLKIQKVSKDDYTDEKAAMESDSSKAGLFGSYLKEAEAEKDDETPVEDDTDDDDEEEEEKQINPQVWLIISSVLIGLILVAVIVVMIYKKLKTKVAKKLRKTKVDSAMPADFEKKQAQEKVRKSADSRKKDIDTSDYND
ncbi:MAG: hypothetical protein IJ033_06325 [Clostridia bacterium]|nr:hypothetical protein [Clostridia bacterium]